MFFLKIVFVRNITNFFKSSMAITKGLKNRTTEYITLVILNLSLSAFKEKFIYSESI